MDVQRFSEHEWRAMAVTLLREATRRQDWRMVAQATALLDQGDLDSRSVMRLIDRLCTLDNEDSWQRMEQEFDSWMARTGRVLTPDDLDDFIAEAYDDEDLENGADGISLYEWEPSWAGLLRHHCDTFDFHMGWAMDHFYQAMHDMCKELFKERLEKRFQTPAA